jgi:multisubunit Na+/H+ antiporter MnhG subunit
MSVQGVAIAVLLSAGVAVEVLCSAGLLVLRSTYDRIHLLGPAAVLGTGLIAAAIVVDQGRSPLGIRAILIALVAWGASPVLSHATMRAAILRSGRWFPDEPVSSEDR